MRGSSRPRPELPQDLLQRVYALTPAEARMAIKLLEAGNLEAAARDLRIAITTARFHLASIFRKTGTEGQADLIRMLLSNPLVGSGHRLTLELPGDIVHQLPPHPGSSGGEGGARKSGSA